MSYKSFYLKHVELHLVFAGMPLKYLFTIVDTAVHQAYICA